MSDSTLHILNRGPAHSSLFANLSAACGPQDSVLLIEDGVYWATPALQHQLAALNTDRIFCLQADLDARGVGNPVCDSVDDSGFVALCVATTKSVSWF